jgi:hypothetical protein
VAIASALQTAVIWVNPVIGACLASAGVGYPSPYASYPTGNRLVRVKKPGTAKGTLVAVGLGADGSARKTEHPWT